MSVPLQCSYGTWAVSTIQLGKAIFAVFPKLTLFFPPNRRGRRRGRFSVCEPRPPQPGPGERRFSTAGRDSSGGRVGPGSSAPPCPALPCLPSPPLASSSLPLSGPRCKITLEPSSEVGIHDRGALRHWTTVGTQTLNPFPELTTPMAGVSSDAVVRQLT